MSKLVLHHINKIYTVNKGCKPGSKLASYTVISNGVIVIDDGRIAFVGDWNDKWKEISETAEHRTLASLCVDNNVSASGYTFVDMKGMIVTPGLIDPHTHLVFGGNRTREYEMKLSGLEYMDILKAGGGILSTVAATRKASEEELYEKAKRTLNEMLACGVTTVEAKSGYGLDTTTEIKQLMVAKRLHETHPIDVISTFMGAHALPPEFLDTDSYLQFIVKEILPIVKDKQLAEFVDVFCEAGIFELEETEKFLKQVQAMGFAIKIHADEIVPMGGTGLAADLGCVSAEHLMKANLADLVKLKQKDVVAVLLPVTSFHLNKAYANAKFMKENDVIMAMATDYNPGSSPCSDLIWAMRIASRGYRLTPKELLPMVTINAAKAIGREDSIGSIEIGKQADLTWFEADDFDEVIVNMSVNKVAAVMKKGNMVYQR